MYAAVNDPQTSFCLSFAVCMLPSVKVCVCHMLPLFCILVNMLMHMCQHGLCHDCEAMRSAKTATQLCIVVLQYWLSYTVIVIDLQPQIARHTHEAVDAYPGRSKSNLIP